MSSLSITPSGYNGLQELGFFAIKAVTAVNFPVATQITSYGFDKLKDHVGQNPIDKIKKKYEKKAIKFWNQKIAYEDVVLTDEQQEQLYHIAYRFFQTVSQGTVDRNLDLLAKLIRKQIDDQHLSYEKYVTLNSAIKDLSLQEMIVLLELCKQKKNLNTSGKQHYHTRNPRMIVVTSSRDVNSNIIKNYQNFFPDGHSFVSTYTLLLGKGFVLLTGMDEGAIGNDAVRGGNTIFSPSNLINPLIEIIEQIDLEIPTDIAETTVI